MNRLRIPGPRPVPPMQAMGVAAYEADLTSGTPRMQVCNACGRTHFPPPCACGCGGAAFRAENLPTNGTLYAATIIHAAPGALAALAPYVVGLVDLQEGPRLLLRVLGPQGWAPDCDSPVQLLVLDYYDGPVLVACPGNFDPTGTTTAGQDAQAGS